MKGNILYLFLLLLTQTSFFGQSITESDLIGKWKVVTVEGMEDMPNPKTAKEKKIMESLKTAFLNATFEFKSDHHFTMAIDFPEIGQKMRNVHWKINPKKASVVIQEWVDRKTDQFKLMELFVLNKNGKTYFGLSESPFLLEVEK